MIFMICNIMNIDINNTDNVTLFWYLVIFITVVYAFSRIDIKLSVVYGTFMVLLILYYLNDNYTKTKNTINTILQTKNDSILPKTTHVSNYNDMVNFLFSIQDFYIYNATAYEDMVQAIDTFFIYYEEVINNNELAGIQYDILIDKKKLALNSLQSIIYKIPINAQYTKKLNDSVVMLNEILQNYIENIKLINENNIYKNGYRRSTKIITNDIVVPYNSFDEKSNFELY